MIDGKPFFDLFSNRVNWQNTFRPYQILSTDNVWSGTSLKNITNSSEENLFAEFQSNLTQNSLSKGIPYFNNSFNTFTSFNTMSFMNFSFNNSFTNNMYQFSPWGFGAISGSSKKSSSTGVKLNNTKGAVNTNTWNSFVKAYGVRETEIDGHKVYACRWSDFSNSQPEWLDLQKYMIEAAEELGLTLVYSDMDRSVSASDAARRKKGDIVAPGGKSPHNYGTAVDICLFKDGIAVSAKSALFRQFAELAKAKSGNRIEWGGEWRKKDEEHHFELRDWEKYKNQENMIV